MMTSLNRGKISYEVAVKSPGGLGNAAAKPKAPGIFKCSEAAEERSGWNC
jgi:hypothetical protein